MVSSLVVTLVEGNVPNSKVASPTEFPHQKLERHRVQCFIVGLRHLLERGIDLFD